MDKLQVADAVRKYIRDQHPGGATLEVLDEGIHHEEDWWYVMVRPDVEPPKRYELHESLAAVEEELEENDHLTVLLIPVGPEHGR